MLLGYLLDATKLGLVGTLGETTLSIEIVTWDLDYGRT